jgi:hypothetical protein
LMAKSGLKSVSTCTSGIPLALSGTITIRHREPGVSTRRVLDKMDNREPQRVSSAC